MKLTTSNLRKMLRKQAMIEWLEKQPVERRFAPDSPCACMYHDMLCEIFDSSYAYPTYTEVTVGEEVVRINRGGFCQKFQEAAAYFAWRKQACGIRTWRNGCPTISRDEAIEVAKGI